MASLKLSDSAFGSVGLTIDENIDLAALSASLSALLGQNYQIDSLDVSRVTLEGLPGFDPQLNTGGLTVAGLGLVGSRLAVGAFDTFFSSFDAADPLSVRGFETLAFTPETIAEFVDFSPSFFIFDGGMGDSFERILSFDEAVRIFDFSALGEGRLDIFLDTLAPGDTVETPSGYRIIGNDGNTVIHGYQPFEVPAPAYNGSNDYILGEGENTFFGGADNATVTGGSGRDLIFGGSGDDSLLGGAGNDTLFGGVSLNFGTSTLEGGAGNDWLYGSSGNHELTGGADGDRFVFVNNYEIAASGQGESILTVNTGFAVSNVETGVNRVTDFVVGEDLLALGLDDVMLDPQSGSLILEVSQRTGALGEAFIDFFVSFGGAADSYSIEDGNAAIDVGNFIFLVEQSTALITDRQYLDKFVFNLDQEGSFDGSFELVYRSADQSQGSAYDVFQNLRIQPVTAAGVVPDWPIGGQDKFDLTALGLTDFVVGEAGPDSRAIVDAQGVGTTVAGTEVAVEDILFTSVDFDYLLDRLLAPTPSLEDTSDFFLDNSDPDNPVYRAMHVEYTNIDGEEFVAYIDADRNGGFDLDTDMVFFVRLDLTGNSVFPVLDDVTDLFNPLAVDGGTGIFIFDQSQYDFWLNDDFLIPQG